MTSYYVDNAIQCQEDREDRRAAAAVVRAAMCFQEFRDIPLMSAERQQEILEALLQDPEFTEVLFQESFYQQN